MSREDWRDDLTMYDKYQWVCADCGHVVDDNNMRRIADGNIVWSAAHGHKKHMEFCFECGIYNPEVILYTAV